MSDIAHSNDEIHGCFSKNVEMILEAFKLAAVLRNQLL